MKSIPSTSGLVERPTGNVEWNFLLAASLPEAGAYELNRIQGLLKSSIGWNEVLRLAEYHGTSCLVYRNLSQLNRLIATETLARLRERYESNVHKSLFLARELMRVLDCAETLGIEVIPYKGAALSEKYYGDMATRQAGDMDLFVRVQDVVRLKDAVHQLGYTPRVNIPQAAERNYLASGYEFTFDSPAGTNLLELQWALQPRFYAVDFDVEGLFARAVTGTVAGRSVKRLSGEDLLIVLCLHAAKHAWEKLIWLCDIAQIAKRERLNWDWVRERSQRSGIERILHISLLLARKFFSMEIPPHMQGALERDLQAAELANQVVDRLAQGISYGGEQPSYFRFVSKLREHRVDRLRFLTRLAFTPGPGEWEAMRFSQRWFALYRVVRVARLVRKLMQGL